jgi:hypothetical protein
VIQNSQDTLWITLYNGGSGEDAFQWTSSAFGPHSSLLLVNFTHTYFGLIYLFFYSSSSSPLHKSNHCPLFSAGHEFDRKTTSPAATFISNEAKRSSFFSFPRLCRLCPLLSLSLATSAVLSFVCTFHPLPAAAAAGTIQRLRQRRH